MHSSLRQTASQINRMHACLWWVCTIAKVMCSGRAIVRSGRSFNVQWHVYICKRRVRSKCIMCTLVCVFLSNGPRGRELHQQGISTPLPRLGIDGSLWWCHPLRAATPSGPSGRVTSDPRDVWQGCVDCDTVMAIDLPLTPGTALNTPTVGVMEPARLLLLTLGVCVCVVWCVCSVCVCDRGQYCASLNLSGSLSLVAHIYQY